MCAYYLMHNKMKGVSQARAAVGEQCTLGGTEPARAHRLALERKSVSGVEQRPQKAHGRAGAPSPTPSPTPVLPRSAGACSPATRLTGPALPTAAAALRTGPSRERSVQIRKCNPVHIISQVPPCSELKVVDQDGNTVGSHEVIWISRKTLVLPGFGVTYERKGARHPVATTLCRQTDIWIQFPSISSPSCPCTLSAR